MNKRIRANLSKKPFSQNFLHLFKLCCASKHLISRVYSNVLFQSATALKWTTYTERDLLRQVFAMWCWIQMLLQESFIYDYPMFLDLKLLISSPLLSYCYKSYANSYSPFWNKEKIWKYTCSPRWQSAMAISSLPYVEPKAMEAKNRG